MGKKILVVDDEKLIVKGIRFSLEQDGMEVDTAFDGEEAVEKAKAKAEGADKAKRAPKGEFSKRAPRKTIRKNADGEAAEKTAGNEEAAEGKKPARKRAVKEVKTLSDIKKSDVAAE